MLDFFETPTHALCITHLELQSLCSLVVCAQGHGEVLQIEPHGDEDLHEGSFSQQIPHRFYRTSALVTEPARCVALYANGLFNVPFEKCCQGLVICCVFGCNGYVV